MDGRELKLFNERTMEAQFLRRENAFLRSDRNYLRVQLFHVDQLFSDLRNHNQQLVAQNQKLSRQVSELTAVLRESGKAGDAATVPAFVKPDKLPRRRKRPGRKAGHAAALRPMPEKIDVHQDVPLPADPQGRVSCPKCNACLLEVKEHERIVEDIIPEQVVVKCYHTQSGWCPGCRKVVESRHKEQPPASNLPHGQLGLNALATGVLLRITHRLPFRQISEIFADLPGLSVSPGAIAAQMQRVADWLAEDYQALKLQIRAAGLCRRDRLADRRQERPALGRHHADANAVSHRRQPRRQGCAGTAGRQFWRHPGQRLLQRVRHDGLQETEMPDASAA